MVIADAAILLHRTVPGSGQKKVREEKVEKKPSGYITELLDFLESSEREYESAFAEVGEEDCKVQTFLHDMEFAENRSEEHTSELQSH